jgi:hypothetical protein
MHTAILQAIVPVSETLATGGLDDRVVTADAKGEPECIV